MRRFIFIVSLFLFICGVVLKIPTVEAQYPLTPSNS